MVAELEGGDEADDVLAVVRVRFRQHLQHREFLLPGLAPATISDLS